SRGEAALAEKIVDEDLGGALHLGERGRAIKFRLSFAHDFNANRRRGKQRFGADQYAGAQRAASVINLRLGKIERVFAFDIARTHVVADGIADDLAMLI